MDSFIFNIQRFSLHDGPGIRTSIFYKGCPLRCAWCSNPESQKQIQEQIWDNSKQENVLSGYWESNETLLEEILKDEPFYEESNGGVTLTGGEVLNQVDSAVDLIKLCKENNIHTACETSGYSSEENFIKLMSNVDLFIMDIKHYDSDKHIEKTGVSLKLILKNLKILSKSETPYLIRIPVIPSFNETLKDAKGFAKLLNKYNIKEVELLPFHQFGEEKYKYLNRNYKYAGVENLSKDDLIDYKDIIENEGINVILK